MRIQAFLPHKCPAKKVITKKTYLARGVRGPFLAVTQITPVTENGRGPFLAVTQTALLTENGRGPLVAVRVAVA